MRKNISENYLCSGCGNPVQNFMFDKFENPETGKIDYENLMCQDCVGSDALDLDDDYPWDNESMDYEDIANYDETEESTEEFGE